MARQLTEADALAAHARDELGLTEVSAARPVQAGATSAVAFSLGALVPLLAYLAAARRDASGVTVVLALVALAVLGAVGAALGRRQPPAGHGAGRRRRGRGHGGHHAHRRAHGRHAGLTPWQDGVLAAPRARTQGDHR